MGEPAGVERFDGFDAAARAVLRHLRGELGLRLWMVTRAVGDAQVVLVADEAPEGYGVAFPAALPWSGSLCVEMVRGRGPSVAPRVADVPAYAAAPNRELAPIGAYVGVPLRAADGAFVGTLCAFDPDPQPADLALGQPLVELQARLLATVLGLELELDQQRRARERAEAEAVQDTLTGLVNRRGWDLALEAEEARCRRYGCAAAVLVIDLDELKLVNDARGHADGDALLRRAADALRATARSSDLVARLGGDEFGLLAVEVDEEGARAQLARVALALAEVGVAASIGVAMRRHDAGLADAWHEADRDMYAQKRRRPVAS